jgi:hypothetical protein
LHLSGGGLGNSFPQNGHAGGFLTSPSFGGPSGRSGFGNSFWQFGHLNGPNGL